MKFITLDTIVNDILSIVRGSIVSQSEPISKRQIEDWINQYRSILLKRDLDKGKYPNPDFIQEIPFVELEEVPVEGDTLASGYSGYTFTGSNVLRTKLSIPKPIDFNFKNGFTFIGKPDGTELQIVPEHRARWQQYKKYTSSEQLVYHKNDHLYVTNAGLSDLSHLYIRGIFEIPSEVGRFVNPATDIAYFNESSKYPVPANLVPAIKEFILSKELQIETSAPSDTKNDDAHGVAQNVER